MSKTKIEWTGEAWNPIIGCEPVSEGCENCYAHRMAKRLAGRFGYPKDEPLRPATLHADKLTAPLKWKKPRRVFVCSMGDLFHEDVEWADINKVWSVMLTASQHTFQVLTKRPDRAREFFADQHHPWPAGNGPDWVAPNIWIGVTAENQQRADERIPKLLQIPAAMRFVSCEPLLGPIDIDQAMYGDHENSGMSCFGFTDGFGYEACLDWIIAGGESGPGARPTHPDWVRSLRDQCVAADVPFLFKQWGAWAPTDQVVTDGPTHAMCYKHHNFTEFIREKMVEQCHCTGWTGFNRTGKKEAGRELDGETWDQFPDAVEGGE